MSGMVFLGNNVNSSLHIFRFLLGMYFCMLCLSEVIFNIILIYSIKFIYTYIYGIEKNFDEHN